MNRLACLALLAAVAPLAVAGPASAQSTQQTPPSTAMAPSGAMATAASFVPLAASANQFEIDSSQLALQRAQSAPVKEFAQQMVKDHTAAAAKMKLALATTKLQPPPAALNAKDQQALDSLRATNGAAFDKAYVEAQYKAHTEAVALFTAYAQNGDNPALKALAGELLPTLKSHLEHVSKLRAS